MSLALCPLVKAAEDASMTLVANSRPLVGLPKYLSLLDCGAIRAWQPTRQGVVGLVIILTP